MTSYRDEMREGIRQFLNMLADLPDDFVDQIHDIEREKTMSTQLKIKIMSLSAEAVIIRRHERKLAKVLARKGKAKGTDATWSSIQSHRRHEVRWEQRHSLLAYAFLRGKSYADVEKFCWADPDLKKVEEMAKRFAPGMEDFAQRWGAWEQDAKAHLKTLSGWRGKRDRRAGEIHLRRLSRVPLTAEQRAARKARWVDDSRPY